MSNVVKAVSKASKESDREGKWASKPEISRKIVGRKPSNLSHTLSELVEEDKIAKKPRAALYRINKAGGGGVGKSGNRTSRGTADERRRGTADERRRTADGRRTTRRTPKGSRRTPTTRDLVTSAVTTMLVGGTGTGGR